MATVRTAAAAIERGRRQVRGAIIESYALLVVVHGTHG
jgi:hypothetical protein